MNPLGACQFQQDGRVFIRNHSPSFAIPRNTFDHCIVPSKEQGRDHMDRSCRGRHKFEKKVIKEYDPGP